VSDWYDFLGSQVRDRKRTDLLIADDRRCDVLVETLMLAVPLRIWEMRGWAPAARQRAAQRSAQVVAERGDDLMFGSRKTGRVAQVFNALAEGLAAAAFQPGGVRFAGRHWCTDHARCERAAAGLPDAPVPGECGDGYGSRPPARPVDTVQPIGGVL